MKLQDLTWEILEVDFSKSPAVVDEMRHKAGNGWTISVVSEVKPAIANVAAWPSDDSSKMVRWFQFADGKADARCYSHQDIEARVNEVLRSPAPGDAADRIVDDTRFLIKPEAGQNSGAPWTEEEMYRLIELYKAGGAELAGTVLGRTATACQSRFSTMKTDMGVPYNLRREALKIPNRRGVVAQRRRA